MKRTVSCVLIALLCAVPLFARSRTDLNADWLFSVDPEQVGEKQGWQNHLPPHTDSVSIPHTWNLGEHDAFLGKAWYFKTFDVSPGPQDRHVRLHFGATFYSARLWINGVELGTHQGGYSAYSFDITPHLRRTNFLAVEIDNRIGATTIPGLAMRGAEDAWYDWWAYGGIVRDVWLILGGSIQVTRQQIRSQISPASTEIVDRIFLDSKLSKAKPISVRLTAFASDNQVVARELKSISMTPGTLEATITFQLTQPQLWNLDHPDLYRIVVQLATPDGAVLDEQNDTFGIRKIEIRDRHLLINGERVRLTGVARHEESVWEGLAETAGTMRHDYDDMKALDVTLTRPVHYPQNPFILDYADRHGILLVPEIPVWQFSEAQLKDPKVLALAKQQIREMIEESGNHPSIFAWSVCNESATATPGGIAYFRAMRDLIREIDPGRFVSYADDKLPELSRAQDSAANDADFLMMNQYFGSWHGREEDLSASLDKIDRMFPHKTVIISEFGLAGIFAKNPEEADSMRIRIIEQQMPELARRDWIAGAILWCYQDYKSRRNLRPGWSEGFVDHGLVDPYRQRKPSYYVWKEINAPAAIDARWNSESSNSAASFRVSVEPNTAHDLPFYPLHNYRLLWELCDERGTLLKSGEQQFAELTTTQTITASSGEHTGASILKLHVALLRPSGTVAVEKSVDLKPDTSGRPLLEDERAISGR
jgi:beta-glucuronidase